LAYELWARDEVTAASTAETVETQPEIQLQQDKPLAASRATKKKPAASETPAPLPATNEAQVKKELIDTCVDLVQSKLDRMGQLSWIADKATKWDLDEPGSKLAQMTVDQLQICIEELKGKPDINS
jgi:hypothetical protein